MRTTSVLTLVAGLVVFCSTAAGLPVGYDWQEYNGHYYALTVEGPAFWEATEAEAVAADGHLVTINDQAEQEWLNTTFPSDPDHPYWIGLIQPPGSDEPDGGWEWLTGEPAIYTNWHSGEPNNLGGNEDRAVMHGFALGHWVDVRPDYGEYIGVIEIPEPTTLSLLALGGLALLRRRR